MLHSGTCDSADVRAECVIPGRVYVIHNVDAFFQLNKCFASWWKTLIPDLLLRYKEGSYYYAIYTIATFLGKYCIAIHKWALWVLIKTSHFVCRVRNKKLLANMLTVAITFIVNRNCCLLFFRRVQVPTRQMLMPPTGKLWFQGRQVQLVLRHCLDQAVRTVVYHLHHLRLVLSALVPTLRHHYLVCLWPCGYSAGSDIF